jgi:hypothetical protein
MSQTIQLSDESVALLKRQAEAHGISVEAWVLGLAREKAPAEEIRAARYKTQAAVARILDIQKRVKPDPEGWSVRDYIDHGRKGRQKFDQQALSGSSSRICGNW